MVAAFQVLDDLDAEIRVVFDDQDVHCVSQRAPSGCRKTSPLAYGSIARCRLSEFKARPSGKVNVFLQPQVNLTA
jgi:hypothetical protein